MSTASERWSPTDHREEVAPMWKHARRWLLRNAWVPMLLLTVPLAACGDVGGTEEEERHVRPDTIEGRIVVENIGPGLWERDGERHSIAEDLTLGRLEGRDDPQVFGDITGLDVSPEGDIAVLDGHAREVRVFDREGSHLVTLGGRGEGPGEFQGPSAVHFDGLGRVWVVDPALGRYSVFAPDGEHLRVHSRPHGGASLLSYSGVSVRDGHGFIDPAPHRDEDRNWQRVFVRVDTAGEAADTLASVDVIAYESTPVELGSYLPTTRMAPDLDGQHLWLARSDDYAVYRIDSTGDTILEIRRDVEPRSLTSEQRDSVDAAVERWPRTLPDDLMEAVGWQYVGSLYSDQSGRLYVRPRVEQPDQEGTTFDAFDEDGRYLGRLRSDIRFDGAPLLFRGDYVYGATEDERGVPLVVRGRITSAQSPSHPMERTP